MNAWRPTGSLVRAVTLAAVLALVAVALGRPDLLVLAAPFGLLAALALANGPRSPVVADLRLADRWLQEGQSTRLRVDLETPEQLEQVTVSLSAPAFVVTVPPSGLQAVTPRRGEELVVPFVVSPRRWGVRSSGTVRVGATSKWGGYRWGPSPLPEKDLVALPQAPRFTSVENPHAVGLVGQNRSRRGGDGAEFFAIRPFQPGDRLRRINWRTTLRTGELMTVESTTQEDSSVMILLDAVTDVGASGGVDGEASSLDLGVRAASALAAHHTRVGDRVALRVLGRTNQVLGPGSGQRHQRRLQQLLAQVQPGWPDLLGSRHLRLRVGAGTVVVALTPLLTPEVTGVLVSLAARGLTLVCIDTLAPEARPTTAQDPDGAGRLAWRMRLVERRMQVTEVERRGIPVVPWRGPGTLDEVLRRVARRGRLPREVTR